MEEFTEPGAMTGNRNTVGGYTLDEIDAAATDILHSLAELEMPPGLAILAACRLITILGCQSDLDHACRYIDQLSEQPFEGREWYVTPDDEGGDEE